MANIKISELPQASALSSGGDDLTMIIQGGSNKKITWADLLKSVQCEVVVNSDMGTSDFTVHGLATPDLLKVSTAANRVGVNTDTPDELFHVKGTVKVGGSEIPGNFIVSDENLIVPTSGTMTIGSAFVVTNIETISNSLSTMSMSIGVPSNMQLKIVTYSKPYIGRESSQNFTMTGPFHGFTMLKFSNYGDSVTLLGVGTKWALVGYNGATIIT
jgi:hypothetical protein